MVGGQGAAGLERIGLEKMSVEEELNQSVAYTPIQRMRHSAAHVMAEAVQELFPGATFRHWSGHRGWLLLRYGAAAPADAGRSAGHRGAHARRASPPTTPLSRAGGRARRRCEYFREHDQPYKVEIIENLPDAEVGIYQQGPFLDLCRGPHVESTGQIGAVKLLRVAGAYWRGDEHRPMLQRLYGTAWFTQEELDAYLERLEEAKRRDHRKLGKDLELFMISDEVGAGLPLWLPKGATVRRLLEEYILGVERAAGLSACLHARTGQAGPVQDVGALGALPRLDVSADGDGERRRAGAAPDELPAPHPDLQAEDALLPRPAHPHRRAGHDVSPGEVRRAVGALAGAGDDAERRAHLLHAGADAGRVHQSGAS